MPLEHDHTLILTPDSHFMGDGIGSASFHAAKLAVTA